MRIIRPIAAIMLAVVLSGLPTISHAQTPDLADLPLARRPEALLPLEGTSWRLRDYRLRGQERSSGPEVAAWMTLRGGALRGSGGCWPIDGRYGVMGSVIDLDWKVAEGEPCAEQTMLVQLGMQEGLRRATSYELITSEEPSTTELVLRDAKGHDVLGFTPDDVSALDVGEWHLDAYTVAAERVDADASQPAVLAFRPSRAVKAQRRSEGDAVGSTGCNGLVGPYFRYADVMSFGELERTDAPCTSTLAAQEDAIVSVLDATSLTLELPPDRLILASSATGDQLEFVTSTPLESSTWLLAGLPGVSVPAEPVTLRLLEGGASGEGPCGPYAADYTTDGRFITFSDVRGSDDDACPARTLERALLTALRDAVLLDRGRPQLRLLDARGKVLARFKQPGSP